MPIIMKKEIAFSFSITEQEYKHFFDKHYSTYRIIRYRPYYGMVMILYGLFSFVQEFHNEILSILFIVFGLYFLLSKKVFIYKAMKTYRTNPKYGENISVKITDESIEGHGEGFDLKQCWDRFIGYSEFSEGLMIYAQRNLFYIIPKKVLDKEDIEFIKQIFEKNNLKEIKA